MPKFFGKNEISKPSNLTSERVKYYLDAYQKDPNDGLDQQPIVNFNIGENTLYGRVDQSLVTVYPKSEFVVPVSRTTNQESVPRVLDFVADMFTDLSNNFEKACRLQIQPSNDPYLSSLKAYQSYNDPKKDYRNYMRRLMRNYYKNFLITRQMDDEIMSLDDFIVGVIEYSKLLGQYDPFSFTGFLSSNQSSIFNSGLAISISPLNKGDDVAKETFFLNNPAFQYYLNLAKNLGFSVSKNSPWVLVADLASPAIKPYINQYNLFTVADIFNNRYNQTHLQDIDLLLETIITYYREFVNIKPYKKIINSCDNKTNIIVKFRETINNYSINNINNNIIYNLYCNIRNIEERNILNNNDLNRLIRDSIAYEKILAPEDVYNFINQTFVKQRPQQDGGFLSIKKKEKQKKSLTKDTQNDILLGSLFTGRY